MSRIYEQPSMTPDDTAVFAIEKGADNNWTTYKTTWGSLKTLLSAATDIQYNAETGVFTFTKTDGNVITITPHDPTKVDKVAGKGLSENDFTNTLKTKLDNIAAGAEANVQSDWNQTNNEADDYIKNKPTIPTVDAALDATSENAIQNKAVKEALDDKVDAVEGKGLSTEDYTAAEKTKLAGVEAGANNYVLPPATASTLGGVKPGINMSVDANGVLSMASTDIVSATEAWLDDHIDPTTGYAVDNTLEVAGAAADAKTAGDKISEIKSALAKQTGTVQLEYVRGKYIYSATNPIDFTDIRDFAGAGYYFGDCEEGEVYTINGRYMGTAAYLIVVTDDSGNVIKSVNQGNIDDVTLKDYELIIPSGGKKLILHNNFTYVSAPYSIKGRILFNSFSKIEDGATVSSVLLADMFESGGIIVDTGEESDSVPRARTKGYIDQSYSSIESDNVSYRFMIFAYDDEGNYVGKVNSSGTGYEKNSAVNWSTSRPIPSQFKYHHRIVTETNYSVIQEAIKHISTKGYANTLRAYVDSKNITSPFDIPWNYYASDDSVSLVADFDALIAKYDELVTDYPGYVTKNTLTSNDFTNYEYVFTTGAYNHQTGQRDEDSTVSKPVILITTGVHGYEKSSIMSTYSFFKALCDNIGILGEIKEKLTIKLIPCVTPWGFNNNTRWNENGVNINRNFNANWTQQGQPFDNDYSGPSAASEDETKVVQTWLDSNIGNAVAYIDHHNSGYGSEVSYLGMPNTLEGALDIKKQYRYSIDTIISYWKFVRNMTSNSLIYGYTGQMNINGSAGAYGALNVDGKPSMTFETSWNQNSFGTHSAKTIGIGSEALACLMYAVMKFAE